MQTGLAALPAAATGFFIFPVDHPLVADDDLVALVRAATETAREAMPLDTLVPARDDLPHCLLRIEIVAHLVHVGERDRFPNSNCARVRRVLSNYHSE